MKFIALKAGFFEGKRVRAGAEFDGPAGSKGKWFVPAAKYKAPPKVDEAKELALSQINKSRPQSFVEAMKKPEDPNAPKSDADDLLK